MITTGLIGSIGDLASQMIEHVLLNNHSGVNFNRLLTFVSQKVFYCGPFMYIYYNKVLPLLFPKKNVLSSAKKLCLDQLLILPISIILFYIFINLFGGNGIMPGIQDVKEKFF